MEYYRFKAKHFQAGQITDHIEQWRNLTSDPEILETVAGQSIEFTQTPVQIKPPFQPKWSQEEAEFIDSEIFSLLGKGVIQQSKHETGEFISSVFLRPKRDGSYRMILNLKSLNQYVVYHHFKMDTIWTAVAMMKPGCYMASIDLKDAYYSVSIAKLDRKYLKFSWRGNLYELTCFPNGLAFCPRKFTKLLKPVYSTLRQMGHLSVAYIDDSYLQADLYDHCVQNVIDTVTMFDKLGLVVHPEKSVLVPTQRLVFLGFILDSILMRISLTPEKACRVKNACKQLVDTVLPSIRQVAQVLGLLTSSFPGVMYGPLHYRWIEIDKTQALKQCKGNFESAMSLSPEAISDLRWWIESIETAFNQISHDTPQVTMTTDASKTGWGCTCQGTPTGGSWTADEAENHINYLETKAVLLGLRSFSDIISGKSITVLIDNTTAVACLNQMGTCHSNTINRLVIDIWEWCITHNIWLTASHIPGINNTAADAESRKTRRETEWSLNPIVFQKAIAEISVQPDIDLFASRLNYKCERYVSYQPDPGSYAVNAFHIQWTNFSFYAFPPFCIIQKVLKKVQEDKATGLLVVPHWPTQPWWPYLANMLIAPPLILPREKDTLHLPSNPDLLHPLHKTIKLLLCHLSGNTSQARAFQRQLQTSSYKHGSREPKNNTNHTYNDGNSTVVNRKLILFQHLSLME